jgi:hypothetical protein
MIRGGIDGGLAGAGDFWSVSRIFTGSTRKRLFADTLKEKRSPRERSAWLSYFDPIIKVMEPRG